MNNEYNKYSEIVKEIVDRKINKNKYLIDIDDIVELVHQLVNENKIIDELEEWIKEDKEYAMNNFECGRCFNMFDILNKLKELKEGK